MGKLTTHVLDLSRGKPAEGMRISLYKLDDWENFGEVGTADGESYTRLLREAVTNDDGRLDAPLLTEEQMVPGRYELVFHTTPYFQRTATRNSEFYNVPDPAPGIWEDIPIRFRILSAAECLHIPLLIAPGGYSTYRGS
ncbi:hydroxyisourate hydrolase [Gorillibacterium massiliense]|uniref:hydroxyisourate hydrolase n=1 Tax=Gorillibacterium massiliense TaxID=1280390 RepID=UPI0004B12EC3|nr:hydroxyisourate hydrolase [Gorillibacterium massiliense]